MPIAHEVTLLRFSVNDELQVGDHLYVRVEYRGPIDGTNSVRVWIRDVERHGFTQVPVPRGRIVCKEPAAMEYDDGVFYSVR